jgi:hypothetical protein
LLSRISQIKCTARGPLALHVALPAFVIGTVIRGDDPASTLVTVRGTS